MDIRAHARATPQRLAIVCDERRLNFAELEALANRLAALLRQAGLVRGDQVACLLGNGPEVLALTWAACAAGST